MTNIAVVHYDLNKAGGGEAVCMNLIEALQQEDYTTHLFTTDDPNIKMLNDHFDTDVNMSKLNIHINSTILTQVLDDSLSLIDISILNKRLKKKLKEFDLVITTSVPICLDQPSLHYIHSPRFNQSEINDQNRLKYTLRQTFLFFVRLFSGFDSSKFNNDTFVTNSNWTKEKIEKTYSVNADVIYPPIDTKGLGGYSWDEMEEGFVAIGRIEPSKNILSMIDIIEGVRERGHDIHLHIIGPNDDDSYMNKVLERTGPLDYVNYEGLVSRKKLESLINSHKYGLHGRWYEHFGISVAEMVIGRTITFVPDGGGQTEIVGKDKYIYSSTEDAIKKIDFVLEESETWDSDLSSASHKFNKSKFKKQIMNTVRECSVQIS